MTSTTIRDSGLALRGEIQDIVAHAVNWQGEAGVYVTRENLDYVVVQGAVDALNAARAKSVFTDKGDALALEALGMLEPAALRSDERRQVRDLVDFVLSQLHDDETIGTARAIATQAAAALRAEGRAVDSLTLREVRAIVAAYRADHA